MSAAVAKLLVLSRAYSKLAAILWVTLGVLEEGRKVLAWQDLSTSQGVRSASHDDRIGCLGISAELCWAGVYVEERTREVLYLSLDGRASISPGTQATDTIGGCLRWRAEADVLYMVDCDGQPVEWPSVGGLLRREAQRAGELPGFYVGPHAPERRSNPENSGFVTSTDVYFARDPLGFVFTGCVYTLRLPRRSTWTFGAYGDRQHRVVLGADGVVTDVEEGHRVGTWSFAAAPLAPESEVWATGDTVTLHIEGLYGEKKGYDEAAPGAAYHDFTLSAFDGGRAWLLVDGRGSGSTQNVVDEAPPPVKEEDGFAVLSLEVPTSVSLFPQTSALLSTLRYLDGDDPAAEGTGETHETDNRQLKQIVEVFEAQPYPAINQKGAFIPDFAGLIVISRAVPRPAENKEDLACVFNGDRAPSIWLSWSMILCSTRKVKPSSVTLHLTFKSERISADYHFLHTPPPRHTRLAWPPTERFEMLPRTQEGTSAPGRQRWAELSTTLAICTMFKNEAPYLEEWLEYHRRLGISKVYMYDNRSSDKSRDVLRKYEEDGFVLVRDWNVDGAQTEALNDCLYRFRHATRWMTFIDVDEFIDPAPGIPVHSAEEVKLSNGAFADFDAENMATRKMALMKMAEEAEGGRHTYCMPWVNYCSVGKVSKQPGGVIENFPDVEDMGERKIHMQKPLFKALEALTLRMIGPHFLLYATEDIDTQYKRNLRCPFEWEDPSTLRLRHFRSKSLEEYVSRRVGADAAYRGRRYTKEKLEREWRSTNAGCEELAADSHD